MTRLTLKAQIFFSYSVMAAVVCAISIAVSLVMFNQLSTQVIDDSQSAILSQSQTSAQRLASEIASTTAQQLVTLGNSMTKASARFSAILLTTTDTTRPALRPPFRNLALAPTYAEFNFTSGCAQTDACPSDYGPLRQQGGRALPGQENGSLLHSSTYLYAHSLQRSVRSTADWNSVFASSPELTDVRDALALQDGDLRTMYSNNGSFLFYLYLAAKVSNNHTEDYDVMLSTYPGVLRNSTSYDPTTRAWFAGSRSDVMHFYGPYIEKQAQRQVATLSFRQSFPYRNRTVDVVAAAVVSLETFRELVTSIAYPSGGHAVLFNKQTLEVLAWANRTDLVDSTRGSFRTVYSLDPRLPSDLCEEPTFEYTDAAGTEWLAGCADSFNSSVAINATTSAIGKGLTVIVFAQKALALQPLRALRKRLDSSEATIRTSVLSVVLCVAFAVMVCAGLVVWSITSPLHTMRRVALQVIDAMAEDEEARDFAPILNKAGLNVKRTDEVGVLACDFHSVICMMHNKVVNRRAVPRYPPNPWRRFSDEDADPSRWATLTWRDLRDCEVHATPLVDASKRSELASARPAALSTPGKTSSRDSYNPTYRASIHRGKVVPLNDAQLVAIASSPPVGWLTGLKVRLGTVAALLVLGVVGAMLVTIWTVQQDSSSWSDVAAMEVTATQMANLQACVAMKSSFVMAFFAQMTLDMRVASAFYTRVLLGDVTTPTWQADGHFLHSYSADKANPYSLNPGTAVLPFSSYFAAADAKCASTTPPSCVTGQNHTRTRLTSLLDLKMQTLLYHGSYISFLQAAQDDDGFTRYWPLRYTSTFAAPTSCPIAVRDVSLCDNLYRQTKCGNASRPAFPAYETRCRDWYGAARRNPSTTVPAFLYPRVVNDGSFAISGVMMATNWSTGARFGAVGLNFLVSALQTGISDVRVMRQGYYYLVDARNVDAVVIHPRQSVTCTTTKCAEGQQGLTAEEYSVLKRTVLLPGNATTGSDDNVRVDTYVKGGAEWRVASHSVRYGSVDYLLLGTVPNAEIVEFAAHAQTTIDQSTRRMVEGFGAAIAALVVGMALLIAALMGTILRPLDDLRLVMRLALRKDFSQKLPKRACASDMAALMAAITQLLVALRLGSDSDSVADLERTRAVFQDSVLLFAATGNHKGLGASLSNLAALEVAQGHWEEGKQLYARAVALAEEHVAALQVLVPVPITGGGDVEAPGVDRTNDLRRARRVLSDRQGRYAATLLVLQDEVAAISMLSRLLAEDQRDLHIRGCVEKQSVLGHMYLRQGRLEDAERVFSESLTLVRGLQDCAAVRGSAMSEAGACEMRVLCDLAALAEARSWGTSLENVQALEHKYLAALMAPAHIEAATARRVLRSLLSLYGRLPQFAEAKRLVQSLADAQQLNLSVPVAPGEGLTVAKRVVLAVDYSSSMSGSRIRSLKDALHAFLREHVHTRDSVCILSFNNSVQEVLPLTTKAADNAMHMAKRVEALAAPVGGTALYDGTLQALRVLARDAAVGDWIVVLADGPDDKSKGSLTELLRALAVAHVSVAALGVGPDAPEDVLRQLAQAAPCGYSRCVPATGSTDVADLFVEVARMLPSSRAQLEDY